MPRHRIYDKMTREMEKNDGTAASRILPFGGTRRDCRSTSESGEDDNGSRCWFRGVFGGFLFPGLVGRRLAS